MEGSRSAEEATLAAEQILTHNTHLAEVLSQAEKVQGSDQSRRRAWIRNKKQEVLKKSSSLAYELNDRPQL